MKKISLILCFLLATGVVVSAQHAAERKEEIKTGLKDIVKLSDSEISSFLAIEDEYRPKSKEIKANASLSDEEKKAKIKTLNEEKKGKIETLLGKQKAEEVKKFYDSLKKEKKEEKKEDKKDKGAGGN